MNPKPFASLNHFTVPVAIFYSTPDCATVRVSLAGTMIKGGNRLPLGAACGGQGRVFTELLKPCGAHYTTPRAAALAARCALRIHVERVDRGARRHEQPVAVQAAEAEVGAALRE